MNGAGIAAILTPLKGPKLCYAARLEFLTTNNAAEYEAILLGLRKLKAPRGQKMHSQVRFPGNSGAR
jgi:ribonuclease HI